MASIASDSSPPSPGAPASAFLDDHALFLDQSTSSFFPAATTLQEPLPPASASASASSPAARKRPRKRPRASRRPPTTVVTTDTSNFRAMVQEFTGIPAPLPFAPHLGPGVLFGAPHDPTAAAGTSRAPLELLMRPSPLKLPAAPHASPPAAGSFAHSLFASSNANPAGPSSEPYGGFAPTLSGAVPRYDGGGGGSGFDAAEDERVLGHGHGLFSSFLYAGDRYHSH
ncbi:VQ motif-containing protein 22-like [Miscanthus floridulus]|uniref:VQ motif-containing protein 22-like n=1 Tax=Miscanthus floridulus TaxID=154761 RepID=UPI0034573F96